MSEQRRPASPGDIRGWISTLGSRLRHGIPSSTRFATEVVAVSIVRRVAAAAQAATATIARTSAAQPQPSALQAAAAARWRQVASSGAAAVPRRLPLPLTTVVLTLLVLVPGLLLWRQPRPRAVGLEQLLQQVSLLQSFPPSPERPVPALWRERLGAMAEPVWRRQRGPWWQLWSNHVDSPALLAISAATLPGGSAGPLPRQALRVGDLVVIAPDPLSRLLLRDQLLPQQRLSHGLQHRCLERLRQNQSVLWNPDGVAAIVGPLAPLLQRYERGCFRFSLGNGGLLWQGEAGERDSLPIPDPATATPPVAALAPLPADRLLEIEMGHADLLLQGLLERPLIRDPLASRYGIDAAGLRLLRNSPMRLRLRSLSGGPFRAGLELQLPVGTSRLPWQRLLGRLSGALLDQGLSPLAGAGPAQSPGAPARGGVSAAVATAAAANAAGPGGAATRPEANGATWRRADGVVVGGWRWLGSGSQEQQLLFFLGPAPQAALEPLNQAGRSLPAAGELLLRSRPRALAALGLLPGEPPELVRRADQLWMRSQAQMRSGEATAISRLSGGLSLSR